VCGLAKIGGDELWAQAESEIESTMSERYILVDSFRGGASDSEDGTVCSVFDSRRAAIAEVIRCLRLIISENTGYFRKIPKSEIVRNFAGSNEFCVTSADGCKYMWNIVSVAVK